jgi:hypothetical protein
MTQALLLLVRDSVLMAFVRSSHQLPVQDQCIELGIPSNEVFPRHSIRYGMRYIVPVKFHP